MQNQSTNPFTCQRSNIEHQSLAQTSSIPEPQSISRSKSHEISSHSSNAYELNPDGQGPSLAAWETDEPGAVHGVDAGLAIEDGSLYDLITFCPLTSLQSKQRQRHNLGWFCQLLVRIRQKGRKYQFPHEQQER